MNQADAEFLGVSHMTNMDLLSIDSDGAFVSLIDATEYLHQRRFPGPVLSDQRNHFARIDRKVDMTQRHHARETFADAFELENRVCHKTLGNAERCLWSLMTAEFFQIGPELIHIAFVDGSSRNDERVTRWDFNLFAAELF
jgi:hypothetical protein